jgi:hypothetical protein
MLWRSAVLGAGLLAVSAGLPAHADGGGGFDGGAVRRVPLISIMVDDARIVPLRLGDDGGELITDMGAKPVLIAVLAASVAREAHHVVNRLHDRS